MSGLAGSVAVITGASGGIGGAIAQALARAGASLALLGRDEERLAAAAEAARAAGAPRVETVAADLEDDAAIVAAAGRCLALFGGVDVLVHSIGLFRAGRFAEAPVEDLDAQLRINLRSPYLLTQALVPTLLDRKGQVVFINSSAALGGRAGYGAYAASKAALKAFADSLRDEVNKEGVRVLTVFPGRTASAMQQDVHRFEGKDYDPERLMQPEDVAEMVAAALALPRTAEVTDVHVRPMRAG